MKNILLFTYSTNVLVRLLTVIVENCLAPKIKKECDPIIANPVMKMRSSGTSPLASQKVVLPPLAPPGMITTRNVLFRILFLSFEEDAESVLLNLTNLLTISLLTVSTTSGKLSDLKQSRGLF